MPISLQGFGIASKSPRLTAAQFRACFRRRAPKISQSFWDAASECVSAEKRKAKEGKSNQLLLLTQYLCLICTGWEKQHAQRYLAEAYLQERRFHDAWETILALDDDIIRAEYARYRKLFHAPNVPLHVIDRYSPHYSRHWNEDEAGELRIIFEGLIAKFHEESGRSVFEYYAQIQESLNNSIQAWRSLRASAQAEREWFSFS